MKYFITLIILFVYSNFSFLLAQNDKDNTAQLQISVAYFCSIGLYFLV